MSEIIPITLWLPFKIRSVNSYLVRTPTGHVLIDTGISNRRTQLQAKLRTAGCEPGNLNLIVLTHGDFDHIGNCAYLRDEYGAKVAMHVDDAGMAERGDMYWHRKSGGAIIRRLTPILFRFPESNRFTPDIRLEDGCDLSGYGLDARVVHIPGHSSGSIGVLTADGEFFCGDLLENGRHGPALSTIMDDPETAHASIKRLKGLGVKVLYPGHGLPFPMDQLNHHSNAAHSSEAH